MSRVILDCDPGHDDVFAIWLAAGNPDVDLRAITTVAGNGSLKYTTLNARIACTIAGVRDVPIAAGADGPLYRKLHTASAIHGANALGGPSLPEPDVPLDERDAVQLITDVLNESVEPVVLVPTGPLTNIAQLILSVERSALSKIERIVWMGGSTTRGNRTPYAEFNSWADPEAVAVVLNSGIPMTMVGLNITHQALVTQEVRARISAIGNNTARFGCELLDYFCGSYGEVESMPAAPLHDPVAMALAINPNVATTIHTRVDIEVAGLETSGATCVDLHGRLNRAPNATVAMNLDNELFWSLVEASIRSLS